MSTAYDLAQLLDDEEFGTLWATSGWSIHVGQEPANPNTVITLYDTGGSEPHYSEEWENPHVQIRVRGDTGAGYTTAMDKIQAIKRYLVFGGSVSWDGQKYLCWTIGDVMWIKHDENGRPVFVCNFRLLKE